MADMEQIIYLDSLHKVEFFQAEKPSNTVIISFTERGGGTLEGHGFGGAFLLKNGYDVVAVKTNADRWYQDLPVDVLFRINDYLAKRVRPYSTRVGYGSSMGGYAAIKFSNQLKLDRVFAISPQVSISWEWDTRWSKEAKIIGKFDAISPDDIRSQTTYSIAYDPFDPDVRHFCILSDMIDADQLLQVKVPFAGHPVGFLLQAAGCLSDVALAAFDGRPCPEYRRKTRAVRAGSASHLAHMSRIARKLRKMRWARSLIERSIDLDKLNAENIVFASQLAEEQGDLVIALRYSTLASALNPENPYIVATAARHLEKTGHVKQALYFITRSQELAPTHDPFALDKARLQQLVMNLAR